MQIKHLLVSTILIIAINFSAQAQCVQVDNKGVSLKWTAFKTLAKAGVSGTFDDIKLSGTLKGKKVEDVVTATSFSIDALTVNSNKKDRDVKLVSNIFETIKDKKITGKFTKIKKNMLYVSLTMNGVTKEIPLNLKIDKNNLSATGHIDMFDFAMNKQVQAINKACYALHEGKTWSDVALEVSAKFTSCK